VKRSVGRGGREGSVGRQEIATTELVSSIEGFFSPHLPHLPHPSSVKDSTLNLVPFDLNPRRIMGFN